ncbi:MAG: MFS transporter [Terriglobales bacterium]
MAQSAITLATCWRLLHENRNFRRLWLAQVISETGDWFYMVALYAMLLEFTGRAEVLGLAFALQVLPQALTGPVAGVINDRVSRKRVMIASDLARFVIIALILVVRSPNMLWLVYVLLFSETVMWGLFEPARNAVIPNIVAEEDALAANTLSSTTWSMNLFLGAALGGAAAVWLGRDAVFALDATSFLASAALLAGMKFAEPHMERMPPVRLRDLVDYSPMMTGIRYVRGEARMLATIFVKAGLGATGASWVIFPILGSTVFRVTGEGIDAKQGALLGMSFLMGARGLGSILGPLAGARWGGQQVGRLRLGVLLGFLMYGVGYLALAFTNFAPAAYTAVVVSHMGGAMVWVFSTTLLQLMSEDRFRGRVFSAELGFCTTALAITAFGAGWLLDRGVSIRALLVATAGLTFAAGALWAGWGMREEGKK